MLLFLCLEDKFLREIVREKIVALLWGNLETLYTIKSLDQMLYMEKKLYSFIMVENKSIVKHLIKINKIIYDLESFEVKFNDEDKTILFLSSLPISFEKFKDAFLYDKNMLLLWMRFEQL